MVTAALVRQRPVSIIQEEEPLQLGDGSPGTPSRYVRSITGVIFPDSMSPAR
jgi:hypothetical protein